MKRILVYADFDFLSAPQEIGTLGYEPVRGKDHFVFEYSREWLKQYGGILLSGDLMNVPSLQHPRSNDTVFGFVKDSFPDRWGRLLLDRRERLTAQSEGRPTRMLTNYDYLIGIEHFSHQLAAKAGIHVAKTRTIRISKDRDLLLSERFDRTKEGRRIHFASAMSLLGLDDGAGSSTGNGYLDIVDFILHGCTDVRQNLRELYRRVAFNIMFGNTDDHFRNHGFLLTPKGWTLSPAYDINPGAKSHQCLLIDSYTEQSDINALLSASENYMLERQEAAEIIEEVRAAIKDWCKTATELQIPFKQLGAYSMRWDEL